MKLIFCSTIIIAGILLNACAGEAPPADVKEDESAVANTESVPLRYRCAISNGMKGDSLFFDVSADRKTLSNLTFKGYWRCSGKLEQETAAGPEGTFKIVDDKIDGYISEPPGGGATAWRFELHATLNGETATGDFRMNINALGCDSYVLKFTGAATKF